MPFLRGVLMFENMSFLTPLLPLKMQDGALVPMYSTLLNMVQLMSAKLGIKATYQEP